MSKVGKILWSNVYKSPGPYLCISETRNRGVVIFEFFDLEFGDTFVLFDRDIERLNAYWDES